MATQQTWPCQRCGHLVESYDAECHQCGAMYDAFGQRLRNVDWCLTMELATWRVGNEGHIR